MKYDPNIHHRRSIRLKGYDYSQAGLYFVTIVVKNRICLFGTITDGKMILNDAGNMINDEWLGIPNRFQNVKLYEFTVMPNHFHSVMEITEPNVGATLVVAQNNMVALNDPNMKNQTGQTADTKNGHPQGIAPTDKNADKPTVGDMVGAFESITTVQYIRGVKNHNWPRFNGKLWQRNYWEHIIRNEKSYLKISEYILNNPANWHDDKFHKS